VDEVRIGQLLLQRRREFEFRELFQVLPMLR
jgi:hypothetical protein